MKWQSMYSHIFIYKEIRHRREEVLSKWVCIAQGISVVSGKIHYHDMNFLNEFSPYFPIWLNVGYTFELFSHAYFKSDASSLWYVVRNGYLTFVKQSSQVLAEYDSAEVVCIILNSLSNKVLFVPPFAALNRYSTQPTLSTKSATVSTFDRQQQRLIATVFRVFS